MCNAYNVKIKNKMVIFSLILSVTTLLIVVAMIYVQGRREADELVTSIDNLEMFEELEQRIADLEYGVKAHKANLDALSAQIIEVKHVVDDLKNNVNGLAKQLQSTETVVNNTLPFIDTTRGMVETNSRRIDRIEGSERN